MFSHTVVVLLNLACMTFALVRDARASGACMILLLAAVLQSHLNRRVKQSTKGLATLTVFKYSAEKPNSQGSIQAQPHPSKSPTPRHQCLKSHRESKPPKLFFFTSWFTKSVPLLPVMVRAHRDNLQSCIVLSCLCFLGGHSKLAHFCYLSNQYAQALKTYREKKRAPWPD